MIYKPPIGAAVMTQRLDPLQLLEQGKVGLDLPFNVGATRLRRWLSIAHNVRVASRRSPVVRLNSSISDSPDAAQAAI